MTEKTVKNQVRLPGFTLTETLAALAIGTMVLVVVLALYSRAQSGAAGVINNLERNRLPREIFQRISEDIDRITNSGQEPKMSFENKYQEGYSGARLEIYNQFTNAKNQPEVLERIIWQSNVEPEGLGKPGLTLYRSHSGKTLEDNLLDSQKEPWQRELFVPICTGLTHFSVVAPDVNDVNDVNEDIEKWSGDTLPLAIYISVSMAEPIKSAEGTLEVAVEEIISRTLTIDRTRKPTFTIPQATDINQVDMNSPDANFIPGYKDPDPNTKTGDSTKPPPMPASRWEKP